MQRIAQQFDVVLAEHEGRQQTQDVRIRARARENVPLQERTLYFLSRTIGSQAEEEARALAAGDWPDEAGVANELRNVAHVREQAFGLDDIDHYLNDCACHGAAAECRAKR